MSSPAPKFDHDRKVHTIADALLDASTTKLNNQPWPHHTLSTEEHGSDDRNEPGYAGSKARGRRGDQSLHMRTSPRATGDPSIAPSPELHPSAGGPTSPLSAAGKRDFYSQTRIPSDGTYAVENGKSATARSYSALGLLRSADKRAKTSAEISTTSTTVAGRLDSQSARRTSLYTQSHLKAQFQRAYTMPEGADASAAARRLLVSHSYSGKDPTIRDFLDKIFLHRYPTDLIDFGPLVQPVNTDSPIKRATTVPAQSKEDEPWRPQGVLVALYNEHAGPVNRVVVSPDHVFFVTASDDGTVKIWDTARLEKNLTTKSRNTHRHAPGAKVKCLAFVEGTHTLISAATDGSIHAIRADCRTTSDGSGIRYGKLRIVRDFNICDDLESTERRFPGEHAMCLEHFRTATDSTLLIATNRSRIIALNLKTMKPSYILNNPVRHGNINTFCLDKKKNWLVLGTSHGIMDLWDLRFQMRVSSWGLPGKGSPVHRIVLHPLKGKGRWVCVAGGGVHDSEIMVWDIEKGQCVEVYQAGATPAYHQSADPRLSENKTPYPPVNIQDYEAWKVDEEPNFASGVFERMATKPPHSIGSNAYDDAVDNDNVDDDDDDEYGANTSPAATSAATATPTDDAQHIPNSVRALVPCVDVQSDNKKSAFLISGGFDRKVRLWDLGFPEASMVVSGASLMSCPYIIGGGASLPLGSRFQVVHSTPGFSMVTEDFVHKIPLRNDKTSETGGGTGAAYRSTDIRSKRRTLVSLQQQELLKSHLDGVLDIALLRLPYGMTVSVDRGGMIYVFR